MKKNIAIVMLAVVALVCFGGWVHSAQEAGSNYKVMMSLNRKPAAGAASADDDDEEDI